MRVLNQGVLSCYAEDEEQPNDVERIALSCLKLENEVEEILPSNGVNDAAAEDHIGKA
jgi:hypothetical protein